MDTVITYKWEDRSQETALRPYANPEIQTIPDPNNPGQLISLLYDRWSHRYMNTEVMRVSITLRRAEVNPTGSDDDDVVLEIRLPYALGTVEDALGSVTRADIPAVGLRPTYINFAHLPNNVLPPAFPNVHPTYANATPVPTGRLSDTRQTGTASIPNATNREFVIRKGMLRLLGIRTVKK
ncbi:MAG: hypothetical protein IPH49_05060 [Ignavibacteria bacterium]|nr:hypothetical protein [Ignavibacteria bacterium]